jgi:hypothetical protein
MCDNCNEDQKKIEEISQKWMKQQGFKSNTFSEGAFETGFRRMPEGILILQQVTEKKLITEDGITDIPDGPVSGIYIQEDTVDDFINDIIYAMGPIYFAKMLMRTLKKAADMEDDDDSTGQ